MKLAARRVTLSLVLLLTVAPTTVVWAQPQSQGSTGRRLALLVGVSRYYAEQLSPLPGAEPDVTELAKVLRANGYEAEDLKLLTNRQGAEDPRFLPTGKRIRRQLKQLCETAQPNDTVLVALAGHGVQFDADDYYFCPVDADLQKRESMVSIKDLYQTLEGCRSECKVLLVDACREDISPPEATNSADQLRSVTRRRRHATSILPEPPPSTAAFVSCAPGQLAYERTDAGKTHGVFFHAVIRGLSGAAGEGGAVTLLDLERFVKKDVESYVRRTYDAIQHPALRNRTNGLQPLVVFTAGARDIDDIKSLWIRSQRKTAWQRIDELQKRLPNAPAVLAQKSQMLADQADQFDDDMKLTSALQLAEQAIADAPNLAEAFVARARVRFVQKDFENAVADCNRAIQLAPQTTNAWTLRSLAHQELNDHAAALADIQRARRIDEEDPFAAATHAALLFQAGKLEAGFEAVRRPTMLAPDVPMLHFIKAYGLDQAGRLDEAILVYDRAIRLDQEDPDLYCRRAMSLTKAGDYPAALADADAAERLHPRCVDAFVVRVFAHSKQGRHQAAVNAATAGLDRIPDSPDLLLSRGSTRIQLRDFHGAVADLQQLVTQEPGHAQGLTFLGISLMKLGRNKEALQALQRATQRQPDLALAHYSQAAVYIQQRQYAQALPLLEKAIECDPQQTAWKQQRTQLMRALGR